MDEEVIFTAFARRISCKPVVIYDKNDGHAMLSEHVVKALSKVKNKLGALIRCLAFLDKREAQIRAAYPWNSWEITQTSYQQAGTIAQIEYVRKQVNKIKSVIELESIEQCLTK